MSIRKQIIEKEVNTEKHFAEVIDIVMDVIQKFDGKCYNKKFGAMLDEKLNQVYKMENLPKSHYVKVYLSDTITKTLYIEIATYDDTVYDDTGKYKRVYRISNAIKNIGIPVSAFTVKENNKKYFNAEQINAYVSNYKDKYIENATRLEKGMECIDAMKEDMKKLLNLIEHIEKTYDHRIREVYGCSYNLVNYSPCEYQTIE